MMLDDVEVIQRRDIVKKNVFDRRLTCNSV